MTMAITGDTYRALAPSIGVLGADSSAIKQRLDILNQQSVSGLVSSSYGGLGAVARVSLDLRPQIIRADAYSGNIDMASTRLGVTTSVLGQLQQIAQTFLTGTTGMAAQTSQEVDTLSGQANTALNQIQGLLNTQVGADYIFAGEDSGHAPAPTVAFQSYVQSIQTAMGGLAAGTGAATVAASLGAAETNSPFSTTLGTMKPVVQVGAGQFATIGIVAGQNGFSSQQGASTTGSYVRDLIRSLAVIGSLHSSQTALGADFDAVMSDTKASLAGAVGGLIADSAGVGGVQQSLTQFQAALADSKTALTTQVSGVEDVDAAATATAITLTQTQLQASYKLISATQELSLVKYL